jgi:TonB family protein
MSGTQYIILNNLYIIVFWAFYSLFLKKQTFFQLNRLYLLASLGLSFILPFFQPAWLGGLTITQEIGYTVNLPTVTISDNPRASTEYLTIDQLIMWTYFAGMALRFGAFIYKLIGVKRMLNDANASLSYSFFGKIHIGDDYFGNIQISEHEKIHARQWHTADILFAEIMLILNWFNPAVYYIRKELKNVHEFIADEGALRSSGNKKEYAMLLVSQTFEVPINNLVNTFFNQNLLKQRIMMIQKNRSAKSALVRYALLIPVLGMMAILSSATVGNSTDRSKQAGNDKVYTEVDQLPSFPGGQQKFGEFLAKNIKYPTAMKEKGVQGKVFVSFVVEKDGALSNFKILKDVGYGAGKEAMRVLAMSPKWNPGSKKGKKVRSLFTVPISYTLEEAKTKS